MKEPEKNRIISTLKNCEDIRDATEYFDLISQIRAEFEQDQKKRQLCNFFMAIGNPDRMLILDALKGKDRCVCELEAILDKTQPATSHHLKVLEEMKLIRGWKKGKFTHYSLVEKSFHEFEQLWNEWKSQFSNWFGK
jgi:DNA-binding transcriptional ArsR family regulator